jgi:ribonuclease III
LQELVAARYENTPMYELDEDGPDHEKEFTAVVIIDGETLGRGTGGSKKKAEQAAAREAYRYLISGRSSGGGPGGAREEKETEGAGTP